MTRHYDVVVVGAGHAGVQLIANLSMLGYAGSVVLLSEEHELPYERPPLSKDASAEVGAEPARLRNADYWASSPADLRLGQAVIHVDREHRFVTLADGEQVGYQHLVWAAGGSARRVDLAGADTANVLTLRSLGDARRLKQFARPGARVAVVGGGYVGLEVAASMTKQGARVTVVEAQDRLLPRVTGTDVSNYLFDLHSARGVSIVLKAQVTGIGLDGDMASAVHLDDGRTLDVDCIVVGVGMIPNTAPLAATGMGVGQGIEVDDRCRSSDRHIFAIGDCARQRSEYATTEAPIRIESVHNANHQAKVVAAALTNAPPPGNSVPWFWSHQFDTRLQTAGLAPGHDAVVVRGEPMTHKFSVFYLLQGRVLAADCINSPADFAQAKRFVQKKALISSDRLGDHETPLKLAAAG